MLFLVAFCFGRHPAAALVHFTWLCTLPLLMVCWGRRFGFAKASIFAAILVFASPVIGKDGISAYNDLMVATLIYAVFYLLQVWDELQSHNVLILIGLLSGASYGVKYTAFLTSAVRRGLGLLMPCGGASKSWRRSAAALRWQRCSSWAAGAASWWLRGCCATGSGSAILSLPFSIPGFRNPVLPPGHGTYLCRNAFATTLGIKHYWEIPLQLTLRSGFDGGTFGPVFLLAPLRLARVAL